MSFLKVRAILSIYLATALFFPRIGNSQSINEFEIKAVFIYNFTQFIQWPAGAFATPEDPFIIGVVGENVFGKSLEEAVSGESYQSHPIVIKYYPNLKDVGDCHILYVGALINTNKQPGGGPILTIGETKGFMEHGGLLRFYNEGNKIGIEINQLKASETGLNISSKLLRLATIFNEK